jgi:hypothetical protein
MEERCEEIINSYQDFRSRRGITMIFGVARNKMKNWLKKLSMENRP